ncbi:MAG TPA: YcaO-like family protein [Candidatus Eremiobacteraeota bacterium]|nr:MAG: Ribosomal protein S12 methylthiotransferase accessory factor YcaO [bacterium ADurb.Bin363]HPZ09346.1 YcaO-like family protein [Candidatus Eremiobacteraeota bacterium]
MVKYYKDLTPEETIEKAKKILEKNNVIAHKQTERNALNALYYCRIGIKNSEVGVNGKGITEELALASGMAELLERLQNQALINPYDLNPEAREKFGFIYDTNEKLLSLEEFLPLPEDFKKTCLNVMNISVYELWDKYKESVANLNKKIPFLPYYNVIEDKIDYLPYPLISSVYATNGMCGGNSPQEALIHGFCEIFERYVQAEIYFKKLTPPTVPREYIKENMPFQYKLIKMLEDTGSYKIIVKDCSLGRGFPVMGIIGIYKDKNKYAFKLGSDPDPGIALERCLTEYFQGRKIFHDLRTSSINTISSKTEEDYEILYQHIYTRGFAQWPYKIFDDKSSYEFTDFSGKIPGSQKERFEYVVALVKDRGYNIYVRDVSFLGFDSYQILIPGLSEESLNRFQLHKLISKIPAVKYLSNLDKLTIKELKALASDMEDFLAQSVERKGFLLWEYPPFPYSFDESPLNDMSLHAFMSYLYYNLRDFEKAYKSYNEFIDSMEHYNITVSVYLYALKEFFALSTKYPENLDKIAKILKPIYGEDIVEEILYIFRDPDNSIKDLVHYDMGDKHLKCWDCKNCSVQSLCPYKYIEEVYLNVKEQAMNNPIDQMKLRSLF